MTADEIVTDDPWTAVVGQDTAVHHLRAAVDHPVHAYLFVGPHGAGKKAAAGVFAGELLAGSDPEGAARHRELAARLAHPDVTVITPTGSEFRKEESGVLVQAAMRAPIEGDRKIVIAERFHDANAAAMPPLLKVAEEPPDSTIFVFLADEVHPDQVTVASRCTKIEFAPLTVESLVTILGRDGVDPDVADRAARAAAGSIERARVLATDDRLMARHDAWFSVPDRLDGTGAAVVVLVEEIRALIDDAMTPLTEAQKADFDALDAREEQYGTRGSGRDDLEKHHKRVQRRFRGEELRFGFAILAGRYREALVTTGDGAPVEPGQAAAAIDRLRRTAETLERSANEALQLEALLLDLPPLR